VRDPKPFRIAIRTEGEFVNAYWARGGTMDGAKLCMSIDRKLCDVPMIREGFMLVAEAIARNLVEAILLPGQSISHVELEDAPEHEKAGRA
jgi:hypothetical protein